MLEEGSVKDSGAKAREFPDALLAGLMLAVMAVLAGGAALRESVCAWLMHYPHEALAGGSMYAVHLPKHIPAAGSAGGPPLPPAFREFAGAPFDIRSFFTHIIQHPDDLPRAVEWMQATFKGWDKSPGPPPKPPWDR